MANTITFAGAVLRSISRDKNSCTLQFSAEMTAAVAKALDWGEELPDAAVGCKMEGRLAGGSFVLTPKEGKQASLPGTQAHEMQANVSTVGSFQVVRRELEQSRGKGHRRELRFKVESGELDIAMKAEEWITSIGDGKATLKLAYASKATTEEPAEEEETDD